MCYTCTYSLCKGCTKDADYVLIRGNKGLCGICKKTIMLIENAVLRDEEKVHFLLSDNIFKFIVLAFSFSCLSLNI